MADRVNVAALRRLHERWRGGNVLHGEHPAVRDFEKQLEHAIPALLAVAKAAEALIEEPATTDGFARNWPCAQRMVALRAALDRLDFKDQP